MGQLWFIPSYYLGVVVNYNKEKVIATNKITNKFTPTTGITETTKNHYKNFSFISETMFYSRMNIYMGLNLTQANFL